VPIFILVTRNGTVSHDGGVKFQVETKDGTIYAGGVKSTKLWLARRAGSWSGFSFVEKRCQLSRSRTRKTKKDKLNLWAISTSKK